VPPGANELLIEALEMLDHGQAVHHHQPRDRAGMIHGGAEGDEGPAVMACDGELVVAEVPQECDYGRLARRRAHGPPRAVRGATGPRRRRRTRAGPSCRRHPCRPGGRAPPRASPPDARVLMHGQPCRATAPRRPARRAARRLIPATRLGGTCWPPTPAPGDAGRRQSAASPRHLPTSCCRRERRQLTRPGPATGGSGLALPAVFRYGQGRSSWGTVIRRCARRAAGSTPRRRRR
jgi:hypothetical protein